MPRRYAFLAVLFIGALTACGADLLEPSPQPIVGRWRSAPEQLPRGQYIRMLEFTLDGRYTATSESRGIYAQVPVDEVASSRREYGSYILTGDTLRFTEDSTRTSDYLSGTFVHRGPRGLYIEGPPTDPIIDLTPTQLTFRYFVDPGNGVYVGVTLKYDRDR